MKRKRKVFEKILKENLINHLLTLDEEEYFSKVEYILLVKIQDGDIDVSKG